MKKAPTGTYIDLVQRSFDGKWTAWKRMNDFELGWADPENPPGFVYTTWVILAIHPEKAKCLQLAKELLNQKKSG